MSNDENKYTIAVSIPCYHAEKFIVKALDTIYNQTYKNVRVYIVVDDCEYDNTIPLIFEHPLFKNNQVVIAASKVKTTPAKARNKLVRMINDEKLCPWIAFLDVDDYWESNKLQCQYEMAQRYPDVDLWYTMAEWNFADGHVEYHGIPYGQHSLKLVCLVPHSSVLVRSDIPLHIPFNENLKASDDYRWLLDIEPHCKFNSINHPLSHMVIHDDNITTGKHAFVMQTVRVHLAGKEYGWALMKLWLGSGLFVSRWILRKLKLSSHGVIA